jgi:hypothetical protein
VKWDVPNRLAKQLVDPAEFFSSTRNEGWKPSFVFFLWITLLLSLATSVVNLFGVGSTDFSAAYQSQIAAYNFVKSNLIPTYGAYGYLIEPLLIFAFAIPILFFLTLLLHVIYRLIGGKGSILNGWKAACYGTGPCVLGGFLPYISLFAAFYSLAMQFYLGPMTLYRAKESRAVVVFVSFIALAFIEMFMFGTTVGW